MVHSFSWFLERLWGSPVSSKQVAVFRVVICLLFFVIGPEESQWVSSRWNPVGFWPEDSMLSADTLHILHNALRGCVGLALVGFGGRAVLALAGLGSAFFISYSFNFEHNQILSALTFAMLALAVLPANDSWSVDRLLGFQIKERTDAELIWPFKLVQAYVMSIYAAAGFAKLQMSGWDWAFSENFPLILVSSESRSIIADLLLDGPWELIQMGAALVVLLEVLSPFMILSSKLRIFFALEIVVFQVGVTLIMGRHYAFLSFPLIYLMSLPWSEWRRSHETKTV